MLEAAEEYPINLGFYGKGNCSTPGALEEQILAGAVGGFIFSLIVKSENKRKHN